MIKHSLDRTVGLLNKKRLEYADDDSPFRNFYHAAMMLDIKPLIVMWTYAAKHFVSIQDMVDGRLQPTERLIDEKFGDAITYLVLIVAMNAETRLDRDKVALIVDVLTDTDPATVESMISLSSLSAPQLYDDIIYDRLTGRSDPWSLIYDFIHLEILLRQSISNDSWDPYDNSYKSMATSADSDWTIFGCATCNIAYAKGGSDADQKKTFCSRECERQ